MVNHLLFIDIVIKRDNMIFTVVKLESATQRHVYLTKV